MNTIAQRARTAAFNLEVKKDGLSQRQDGRWALRVIIHPNDFPAALSLAPMGTRYIAALVEIGENEEPIVKPDAPLKPADKSKSYAQRAGILCNEPAFWKFFGPYLGNGETEPVISDAEEAARNLRFLCGVQSRRDLIPGTPAGEKFRDLELSYKNWLTGVEA